MGGADRGSTLVKVESHLWRIMRDGRSLGWVAASRNPNGTLELGWGTREDHRNHGHCTKAAVEALAWLQAAHPGEDVIAIIRPTNGASLRVAEKLGMRVQSRTDEHVVLVVGRGDPAEPKPKPKPEPGAGLTVVSYEKD